MNISRLFTSALFFLASPTAFAGEPIPLLIESTLYGGTSKVACNIANKDTVCKMDLGLNVSFVRGEDLPKDAKVIGTTEYRSVSGAKVTCNIVVIPQFQLGAHVVKNLKAVNCPGVDLKTSSNLVGVDLMSQESFALDYRNNYLEFSPKERPQKLMKFRTDEVGHAIVPVGVGRSSVAVASFGMIDTGSATTVVDIKFALAHPELFATVKENIVGYDSFGNPIKALIMIANFFVGEKMLTAQYVKAIDFTPMREVLGEDVHYIIGHNLFLDGRLFIDFKNQLWNLE